MDIEIKRGCMMKSAQSEAAKFKYNKYTSKRGKIWLVANTETPAENIYVEGGPNSNGFGGATLSFDLVDGTSIQLKGPWHSNSYSLYSSTGVDVRNKHRTYVVVSEDFEYIQKSFNNIIMKNVLYKDETPKIGEFDRGKKIAQEIANKLNKTVCLYSESSGGYSRMSIEPNNKEE